MPHWWGTHRIYGGIIILTIEYSNSAHWTGLVPPRYVYRVELLEGSEYKTREITYLDYPNHRMKRDKRGLLIEVQPGGEIGVFNIMQLLLTLTTGLTLMVISTVFVKVSAQFCSTRKKYYRKALYEDFDDLQSRAVGLMKNLDMQTVDDLLRDNKLRLDGDLDRKIWRLYKRGYKWDDVTQRAELLTSSDL